MIRLLLVVGIALMVGRSEAFSVSERVHVPSRWPTSRPRKYFINDHVDSNRPGFHHDEKNSYFSDLHPTLQTTTCLPMSTSNQIRQVDIRPLLPGTYGLLVSQIGVFLVDKVIGNPFIRRHFYLHHHAKLNSFWQPVTSLFCHRDVAHLSSNLFLLLLMGRMVESEFGKEGLLFGFFCCGIATSMVALWTLPKYTVSIGAAGAILGLFFMSALTALSLFIQAGLTNWRVLLDYGIMGFFILRQFAMEIPISAFGARRSVQIGRHVAGALVGALLSKWCFEQ